ncbi:spermidine synthase [Leptospira fletcheri]|uniref:Polyamine aminopropyltransferase n=2 Tax=Leptospira fletcheri TaxID=2484981 RepID=A0A4R9GIS0_9LEPT|nr:spermidine synthase [Leptospira fletcheri]
MIISDGKWVKDYYDDNELHFYRKRKSIFKKKTKFQEVELVELPAIGEVLIIDEELQSAKMDEHIYHETLVHPAMISNENPKKVLILGGGEGATLREVLKYQSVELAVMVDIDAELVEFFHHNMPHWHLGAFDDPRTELALIDGKEYLEKTSHQFDVIIIDLTSGFTERMQEEFEPILNLYSKEFYALCKSKLAPNGIVAVQAFELTPLDWSEHAVLYRTMSSAFSRVTSYSTFIPSFYTNWGFLIASNRKDAAELSPEEMEQRIQTRDLTNKLKSFSGQNFLGMKSMPKDLQANLQRPGTVIEDNKPIKVYPKEDHNQ